MRSPRQEDDDGETTPPGGLAAFGEAVERHKDRLFGFALYFLGDRHQAEDVTQEVLLKLWRNWSKLDNTDVAAWLTTVTRNASYDALGMPLATVKVYAHRGRKKLREMLSDELDVEAPDQP